jgi:nucleoid-associated protein EbfC
MRDMQQMLTQMKKMQADIQQQLDALRVEGSAGGGMVKVTMNGTKRLLAVKIDPEAVKSGDVEMLQDMIQAAFNDAARKVDDSMAEKLGGLAGGLNIPGLF